MGIDPKTVQARQDLSHFQPTSFGSCRLVYLSVHFISSYKIFQGPLGRGSHRKALCKNTEFNRSTRWDEARASCIQVGMLPICISSPRMDFRALYTEGLPETQLTKTAMHYILKDEATSQRHHCMLCWGGQWFSKERVLKSHLNIDEASLTL